MKMSKAGITYRLFGFEDGWQFFPKISRLRRGLFTRMSFGFASLTKANNVPSQYLFLWLSTRPSSTTIFANAEV